ncbi:hypothetical protein KbCgl_14580 [Corynebacterium glutamicum]|nr:hypothetical protein KbCgl_14580 [Corynebacterium glutamicum]
MLDTNMPNTNSHVAAGNAQSNAQALLTGVEFSNLGSKGVPSSGESGTNQDHVRILGNSFVMAKTLPQLYTDSTYKAVSTTLSF